MSMLLETVRHIHVAAAPARRVNRDTVRVAKDADRRSRPMRDRMRGDQFARLLRDERI